MPEPVYCKHQGRLANTRKDIPDPAVAWTDQTGVAPCSSLGCHRCGEAVRHRDGLMAGTEFDKDI